MSGILAWINTSIKKLDTTTKKVVFGGVFISAIYIIAKLVNKKKSKNKKDPYANVPHFKAKMVVNCNNFAGECCIWDDMKGLLYWIDQKKCKLWTYNPKSKAYMSYDLPERPGSFGLCKNNPDLLIMCFFNGPRYYNIKTKQISERFFDFEPNMVTRINDGRCDRQGNFVFGGVFEPITSTDMNGFIKALKNIYRFITISSNIYRINKDLTCDKLISNIKCANSICFSVDGTIMYYVDSFKKGIRKITNYNTSNPDKSVLYCDTYKGHADGSCIDSNGNLWNAGCSDGTICCIDKNGDIIMVVDVPEKFVSCCCFGGELLDTLFITALDGAIFGHKNVSNVGNVYAVKIPNVKGVKESRFDGNIV